MRNKAYWIRHSHILRRDEYECSACGETTEKPRKICPHCGSTMKGVQGDAGWVDEMETIDAWFDD
ncbi:MAG: hypothetical protein IK055_00100 [Lachnospiraceae bacterium]|nr:hypothetical protein [Lachnospiraceae bacterium]